ncbi:MAG: DUF429 domain-containing protein [Candidatus Cyclobacteriaceae bacterium M2_1C_046]
MTIIGLDAAVQDKNIGCILGEYNNGSFTITERWDSKKPFIATIASWIKNSEKAILAIDAPLGWPVSFRKTLNIHCAGRPLNIEPDLFFKRKTDLDISRRFKKTTLEITADRIARTAFFTLQRIGSIEKELNFEFQLLWNTQELNKFGLVEVYPAATLLSNGFSIKGYKKDNIEARKDIYEKLKVYYNFINPNGVDLISIEHDFDAFICCLAGIDFIEGKAAAPEKIDQDIKEEGWIWVKN